MKTTSLNTINPWRREIVIAAIAAMVISLSACGHMAMMMGNGAKKPAQSEFGLGPRKSAAGRYTATIAPAEPLRTRKLQSMKLEIRDAAGQPVSDATIAIDGGMPEHGHGLPTKPRVTRSLGNGTYQVDGVRFNMGGWWELKFAVATPAGTDTVTFNLAL